MGNGLCGVSLVGSPREVRGHAPRTPWTLDGASWPRFDALGSDRRQPVDQDDGNGRPRCDDISKKIVGRKIHLVVDVEGLPVEVTIPAASVQDRQGGLVVLDGALQVAPRDKHRWADCAYTGSIARHANRVGCTVDIVRRIDDRLVGQWRERQLRLLRVRPRFELVRRRRVVERTFGWLGRYRVLSKDDEQRVDVAEHIVWVAATRMLAQRLAYC